MSSFLVVKVLDSKSVALPSTFIYGAVELRSYESDSALEREALQESAQRNYLKFDDYIFCARIATIVDAEDAYEAASISENLFSEILDFKSLELHMSNLSTSNIGFVKNLNSGAIEPILKREIGATMSFLRHQGNIQKYDWINYILSLNSELAERYKRSLHWSRNCRHENNLQIKILFYWFSMEALFKETVTDNISGTVRWFLGFPNGKARSTLDENLIKTLESHKKYKKWSGKIIDVLEEIRIFRNDSVHSGFRAFDVSKDDLELYSQVMIYAASRCQGAVRSALLNKITTVADFKEYLPVIFEENKNIINDVHNNIIFSLEHTYN